MVVVGVSVTVVGVVVVGGESSSSLSPSIKIPPTTERMTTTAITKPRMVSALPTHPRRTFCVTSNDPDTSTGLGGAGGGVTSGLGGAGVAGAASPNSWPHDWQNLAFGATSLPHRPQNVTRLAGGGVTFQVCHPFPEGVGRHRTPRCRYAQRLKGRRMASRSGVPDMSLVPGGVPPFAENAVCVVPAISAPNGGTQQTSECGRLHPQEVQPPRPDAQQEHLSGRRPNRFSRPAVLTSALETPRPTRSLGLVGQQVSLTHRQR